MVRVDSNKSELPLICAVIKHIHIPGDPRRRRGLTNRGLASRGASLICAGENETVALRGFRLCQHKVHSIVHIDNCIPVKRKLGGHMLAWQNERGRRAPFHGLSPILPSGGLPV